MNLLYKAQTRFLFHAHIKIKISAFYDDELFDELFAILEDVDKKYNSYQNGSFIDLINKNAGTFIEVNEETINILKQVINLSNFFEGSYDITIMPLIRLWGFYKNEGHRIPSIKEIEAVRNLIDYNKIAIEGNKVRIDKGQEIITGSFIKAYAVDKLSDYVATQGINDAIINAGGSTIKAINNELHPTWQVVVKNPDNEEHLFTLDLNNECYSTSSQSKTFISIENQKYGHIINPKTGFPSTNKQIGIISNNCMIGDIISTGLYNETAEGFKNKMDSLSKIYKLKGFIIDENNRITYHKDNKL